MALNGKTVVSVICDRSSEPMTTCSAVEFEYRGGNNAPSADASWKSAGSGGAARAKPAGSVAARNAMVARMRGRIGTSVAGEGRRGERRDAAERTRRGASPVGRRFQPLPIQSAADVGSRGTPAGG